MLCYGVEDAVAVRVTPPVEELKAAPKAPAPIPALITMFVASASEVPAGMPVTLCYGAPEARSVSIEPAVEALKPTRRNCFIVKPDGATTYTLTARAPDGYVETAQVTVRTR
jgi:hypothetical protein